MFISFSGKCLKYGKFFRASPHLNPTCNRIPTQVSLQVLHTPNSWIYEHCALCTTVVIARLVQIRSLQSEIDFDFPSGLLPAYLLISIAQNPSCQDTSSVSAPR